MINLIFALVMLSIQTETIEITFGNGGGFTGISHDYALDREGNFYEVNVFTEARTLIKKIDKEKTESIFNILSKSKLKVLKLNEPGNTFRYIGIKGNNDSHKIVWSGISENKNLNLLYKELNTLRKSNE